jgi:hypothetical protein
VVNDEATIEEEVVVEIVKNSRAIATEEHRYGSPTMTVTG